MMLGRFFLIAKNIGTQGLSSILALGVTIVSTRQLSTSDFGELRFIMTILPLMMACSLPGYDSIILRNTSLRKKTPLWKIFKVRFTSALVGSFVILLAVALLGPEIGETLLFLLITTIFLLPLFETATGYRNFLIGRGLRQQSLNLAIQARLMSLILFSCAVWAILNLQFQALWLYPAYLLSIIFPTIIVFLLVIFPYRDGSFQLREQNGCADIKPAFVTTVAGMLFTFVYLLDKILLRTIEGSESLAYYAILVMIPQEIAKLLDSTIPLYYRKLFFNNSTSTTIFSHCRVAVFLLILGGMLVTSYTFVFYFFSAAVFGEQYNFSFGHVLLAGLMILSQSLEFFFNHKIFATFGSNGQMTCAVCNLFFSAAVISIGLLLGGTLGLILALMAKHLLVSPLVFYIYQLKK